MSLIVQKFGGTSLADGHRIAKAADKVARERQRGHRVVVITSAMKGVTNQLAGYCRQLALGRKDLEYDAVLASGEQITAGLLALTLGSMGIAARSWLGWQLPISTTSVPTKARIVAIDTTELVATLNRGEVAVIAGFQGINEHRRLTTLGRGGSDTTAVAVAAVTQASRCDIYTDVDGVYTTDPRVVKSARRIRQISYEEMLELAFLGSKVLHPRSVALAMDHKLTVQVLSSFADDIGSDLPGTLVLDDRQIMEYLADHTRDQAIYHDHDPTMNRPTTTQAATHDTARPVRQKLEREVVSSISYSRDEAKLTLRHVPDSPGFAAAIFDSLAEEDINVDLIVQNISTDACQTDLTFTVSESDLEAAQNCLSRIQGRLGFSGLLTDRDVAKVSVIGIGMLSHSGVAARMFRALADQNINILLISTSEIKISVLIAEHYTELAVHALHKAYELGTSPASPDSSS